MTKQSLFPYYAQTLRQVQGVDVINVSGAGLLHFNNVGVEQIQMLKYPCRIDALIMIVCVRGEISFSSHMSEYTLKANQFFVSTASVFQFHSITDSEFYMLAFSAEFLSSMNVDIRFIAQLTSELLGNARITTIGSAEMMGVARFFTTISAEYANELSEYKECSLRHLFCAIIYRIYDACLVSNVISPVGVKERSSEYFEKLMNLLSEHYREQRSVEFYAEKMHISSKHLSRVIRNFTGKSVHQWIDEFVALEIKNLLKYSNMSIQQISYYLNFPNPSFMGQYFKRITGMTPGEYKKS
uniref:helix-turn-helix domain-containing protein n=1 Tax=Alistipes sp. TaxID=1872444 RepID=UPI00405755C1